VQQKSYQTEQNDKPGFSIIHSSLLAFFIIIYFSQYVLAYLPFDESVYIGVIVILPRFIHFTKRYLFVNRIRKQHREELEGS